MAEEDDVDIVGVFNDDIVQSGSVYPVDDMGLNINELLCPLLSSHNWLLSTDQVWNLENPVEDRSRLSLENCTAQEIEVKIPEVSSKIKASTLVTPSHKKPWTESERTTFVKGLDIYGKSWSKIAKLIGTRTTLQVKNFARQFFKNKERQVSMEHETRSDQDMYRVDGHIDLGGALVGAHHSENPAPQHHAAAKALGPVNDKLASNVLVGHKPNTGEIVHINNENLDSDSEDIDIENVENETLPRAVSRILPDVTTSPSLKDDSPIAMDSSPDAAAIHDLNVEEKPSSDCVDTKYYKPVESCRVVKQVHTKMEYGDSGDAKREIGPSSRERVVGDSDGIADEFDVGECRLFHLEVPLCERTVPRDEISDEERLVHREFFEGRPQKTPERYLRIRNHIVDAWEARRARGGGDCDDDHHHSYLNKTAVRQGLRNCGDVNCIGRVHSYLEQIGAINFGCAATVYVRPFSLAVRPPTSSAVGKRLAGGGGVDVKDIWRPRKRKVPVLRYDSEAGGFTLEHGEDGEVIDVAKGSNSASAAFSSKRVRRIADNPFRLIKCAEYTHERPAPFTVTVCLDALLVMDIHAHLSSLEVIGLLGGHFIFETSELHILSAEPCQSLSTGSECEMDPVSQTLASERLQNAGQSVIGWYHSHPSFEPNPSVRDIETQTKFQEWFGAGGAPFLGVIISPDVPSLPCAKIRYLVVGDEADVTDAGIDSFCETFRAPYRLPSATVPFEGDVADLITRAAGVIDMSTSVVSKTPLTMLNRLLGSIKHHASQALVDSVLATSLIREIGQMLVATLTPKESDT